jgi:hypothetical protein
MPKGKRTSGKNRKVRLRADEVHKFGPITMARRGRVTQVSAQWSPEAHAAMRARLPKKRQELKEKIDADIASLISILRSYKPLPLIRSLFVKNCVGDLETYSEPEHEGSEAAVEYGQSLATAIRDPGTVEPDAGTVETFCRLAVDVLQSSAFYFGLRQSEGDQDDAATLDKDETKFVGMIRHLFLRGSSVREHETELITALFGPHDQFFRAHQLFMAGDLIAFCDRTLDFMNASLNAYVDALTKMKNLHAQYQEHCASNPEADPSVLLQELRDSEAGKVATKAFRESMRVQYDVVPYNEANKPLCDHLSLAPGDNEPFVTFKKSPGWPSNDTKSTDRPLLRIGDDYYCPNPVFLLRNRLNILDNIISTTDADYYQKQFAPKRGQLVETLAIEHFARLLPSAQIYRNAYYRTNLTGEIQRFETDALVVFDDTLFILEAKSASLSTAALRGADRAMSRELDPSDRGAV